MTRRTAIVTVVGWAVTMGGAANAQELNYLKGFSHACESLRARFGPNGDDRMPFASPPLPRCRIENGCIRIDWNIAHEQKLEETLAMIRVTEEAPLRVHTANVNRLRYTVNWTTEIESRSEAFETVSQLFDSVLPVVSVLGGAMGAYGPTTQFEEWTRQLAYADQCLGDTMTRFVGVAMDEDGSGEAVQILHQVEQTLARAMPGLVGLRVAALEYAWAQGAAPGARTPMEIYWTVAQWHADLGRRVAEFLPRARASVEGVTTVLDPHKRNAVVLLKGQAATLGGEPVGEAVSARYFVATTRRLVYHVGYGYGRLKDLDFRQVRTAAGEDLFAAMESAGAGAAESGSGETVAFMSLEFLRRGPNHRYGVSGTIGTGFRAPGRSVYYGVTGRVFSRLLVTFGVVTATATRGEGEVIQATSELTQRTLFSAIKDTTDTRCCFWSVSFRLY